MPMGIIKPMYACNSSSVICVHISKVSPPMHSRAYSFVCCTMYWRIEVVKKREKISIGDDGSRTVGVHDHEMSSMLHKRSSRYEYPCKYKSLATASQIICICTYLFQESRGPRDIHPQSQSCMKNTSKFSCITTGCWLYSSIVSLAVRNNVTRLGSID